MLLARPWIAAAALRRYLPLIGLAAGFALLGLFVSVVNRTPLDIIVNTLLEVHFQIVVLMLVAAILAQICGARLCMWAIVAVICGSAFFALLQMLGFEFAWDVRKSLGPLAMDELRPSTLDWRPTGPLPPLRRCVMPRGSEHSEFDRPIRRSFLHCLYCSPAQSQQRRGPRSWAVSFSWWLT